MIIAIIMAVCSVMLMLFAIITGGNIEWTFNMPATIVVLGLASLSTIGAKAANSQINAVQHFGQAAVRAGWIAFIIGLIMTIGNINQNTVLIDFLPRAIVICLLTPLYGYVLNFVASLLAPAN